MILLRKYLIFKDPVKHKLIHDGLSNLDTRLREVEHCYNVVVQQALTDDQNLLLNCLLSQSEFDHHVLDTTSLVDCHSECRTVIEIGPRNAFISPFSTNTSSLLHNAGLTMVTRVELSIRYLIETNGADAIDHPCRLKILSCLSDSMLECEYPPVVTTTYFSVPPSSCSYRVIPIDAITVENVAHGWSFDDADIAYYTEYFKKEGRNPTEVELYDLAQSNSEHSRHWFFKGRIEIDGSPLPQNLFQMIMQTQEHSNKNSVICFSDNSSAIRGFDVTSLNCSSPTLPSSFSDVCVLRHPLYTAETHNFPTGVCPFPGAATGTGGRIRDTHATGRGSHVVAAVSAYAFGNLHIPGYDLPWESKSEPYPDSFAKPLDIIISASNGASDYGNKFGEPVIAGFARSFGMKIPFIGSKDSNYSYNFTKLNNGNGESKHDTNSEEISGEPQAVVHKTEGEQSTAGDLTETEPISVDRTSESDLVTPATKKLDSKNIVPGERVEYVKPIMFSGGLGSIDDGQVKKCPPEKGNMVGKLGGPVYRIGVGGGAASSSGIQGDGGARDFNAVQRGDPQMGQKLNRVIRSCIELGNWDDSNTPDQSNKNPILTIHDQGAGGNGNVLKEITEPLGGRIFCDKFNLGDYSIGPLEIWVAEYQESDAILFTQDGGTIVDQICKREKCELQTVGEVNDDGRIILEPLSPHDLNANKSLPTDDQSVPQPVNMDLSWVLGNRQQKTFKLQRRKCHLPALTFNCSSFTLLEALDRVLRLPAVASKRYLTNKVDRSVTGLVAQQQCVGHLQTPLADVAVTALSYRDTVGSAVAVGEQPVKGLVDAGAGARMSVGEALTNLVFAPVTDLRDVKCSGNWMWPLKQPGQGALLVDACQAMCAVMGQLGVAVDGGKDSLSMSARVGEEVVNAPGTLVISAYAPCPDITCVITPDLKCPNLSANLLYVRFGGSIDRHRLGGSSLAQVYNQLGNECPDMDDPKQFDNAFRVTQDLCKEGLVSAGHDVSDGGLIVCVLEMAFAGNCGLQLDFAEFGGDWLHICFAEELGIVLEIPKHLFHSVCERFQRAKVPCCFIGFSMARQFCMAPQISIRFNGSDANDLCMETAVLRRKWEETSYQLDRLQANPICVDQEKTSIDAHDGRSAFSLSNALFDFVTGCSSYIRPMNGHLDGLPSTIKVAIVREEGSNGDREMAAAFMEAGFEEVWDVTMTDLLAGRTSLDRFRGVAFVGGFSFGDVLGSATGWSSGVLYNPTMKAQFDAFYRRPDTFSLGVCNGCQLMAVIGWVGGDLDRKHTEANPAELKSMVRLMANESGRFESRFCAVKIQPGPAIMLKDMENSVLGVWVAHGEGKFNFRTPDALNIATLANLFPLRYVSPLDGKITDNYPANPNGSPLSIAGMCSRDGRHLALMPHPERCFKVWQWPHWPPRYPNYHERRNVGGKNGGGMLSPWLKMFVNAREWCEKTNKSGGPEWAQFGGK